MGFHDKMAHHAYLNGKQAKQFEAAAIRNANAFWLWAIIAGLLWWLVDGRWWISPAPMAGWAAWNSASSTMIQTRLEKIEGRLDGAISGQPET